MRQIGAAVTVLAIAVVPCRSAIASEQQFAAVTTFLRDGPGTRYQVTDEVAAGQAVEVDGCADGWCRLLQDRAGGYVLQTALRPTPLTVPTVSGPCFDNRSNGPRVSVAQQFCASKPSAP